MESPGFGEASVFMAVAYEFRKSGDMDLVRRLGGRTGWCLTGAAHLAAGRVHARSMTLLSRETASGPFQLLRRSFKLIRTFAGSSEGFVAMRRLGLGRELFPSVGLVRRQACRVAADQRVSTTSSSALPPPFSLRHPARGVLLYSPEPTTQEPEDDTITALRPYVPFRQHFHCSRAEQHLAPR